MEWYLDAHTCTLYHNIEGVCTHRDAKNIGRLIFEVDAHSCDAPNQYSHVAGVCERGAIHGNSGQAQNRRDANPYTRTYHRHRILGTVAVPYQDTYND
jgi:hypothetical protein